MSKSTKDELQDIADAYRIARQHQGKGAKSVWKRLKEHFPDKTHEEILALLKPTIGK